LSGIKNQVDLYKRCILFIFLLSSCNKTNQTSILYTDKFTIAGNKIYNYNTPVQIIGANAFHVFGAGGSDLNNWHLDIAREFVGNVNEVRLTGNPFQDSNGAYLHSLQSVADSNRANKRITIFCPFQWSGLPATNFTGTMPKLTYWWSDFKLKLQQWAVQFKDQPDVWLEVWNEPYRYDRTDGYTDETWMSDMNELVTLIRSAGNNNVILVPCAEQGQDESVLNNKGALFLQGKTNILFDIHAYEKWLLVSNVSMGNRIKQLIQNKLPVLFGETAPLNAGLLMNPQPFLDSIYNNGLSVCAWVWKYDSTDKDALLNATGQPNDTNNNNWGTTFKTLSLRPRIP
jgi:mannan endo-1,4-beta-mannosidase